MLYSISYILILIRTIFYQNNNMDFALAAIKLVDYIVHEIDKKLTPVIYIYINLSKEFDTLNLILYYYIN